MAVYINETEGLRHVLNKEQLYMRLLKKFKADVSLDALTSAVTAQDYTKAEIEAHTIKGISGNLALTELFNQIQALDTALKAKIAQPDGDVITPESLAPLHTCFQHTLTSIDEALARHV
ncbi:MAG: Hpt domain-containing protein [Treponema sp.]|nr:Hpt domain-containing protein [Treponema sp.]